MSHSGRSDIAQAPAQVRRLHGLRSGAGFASRPPNGLGSSAGAKTYVQPLLASSMARNLCAEVCVGAAIFRGPELLLIRRRTDLRAFPGTWDIPGGHVEQGESIPGALRREVTEETGLSIRLGTPFHSGLFDYPVGWGRSVPTIEVDFLCTPRTSARPRLNPAEHTEFAWVSEDGAPEYPTTERLTRIIRAAFSTKSGSRS